MKYPSLEDYLRRLPDGLRSHPECLVKASVLRDALGGEGLPNDVPSELVGLSESPPPVSSFVSEVAFNATMLVVLDHKFAGDRRAFVSWVYERNLGLLRKPLYRILFAVLSPERLLVGMQKRWLAFRRGTTLEVVGRHRSGASFELHFPSFLHDENTLVGLLGAFRSAAVAAGAEQARSTLLHHDEQMARFELKWL